MRSMVMPHGVKWHSMGTRQCDEDCCLCRDWPSGSVFGISTLVRGGCEKWNRLNKMENEFGEQYHF